MKCDILIMERLCLRSAVRFHGEKYILNYPELFRNPKLHLLIYKIVPLVLDLSRRPG